ncbi:MAG TPA: PhzF family phenazine biosynthesis protein [Sphingomicrobium sp.]
MIELDYLTMDVFTTRPFGGNPLAIIPDASALDGEAMQRITAEFNYSETTFILPPPEGSGCIAEVRIFTPTNELPFAGHPNVGTAWAVASMGELFEQSVGDSFAFHEKAGRVDCSIRRDGGRIVSASIRAPQPLSTGGEIDAGTIAACASLPESAIELARHRPIQASVGLFFAIAELASLEALGKARPNASAFAAADPKYRVDEDHFCLFLYSRVDGDPRKLRARMFAPLNNIPEDPATGSASAALAAFLARLEGSESADYVIEQGVEMGRPSRLELSVRGPDVRVGGPCVPVMRGKLEF